MGKKEKEKAYYSITDYYKKEALHTLIDFFGSVSNLPEELLTGLNAANTNKEVDTLRRKYIDIALQYK